MAHCPQDYPDERRQHGEQDRLAVCFTMDRSGQVSAVVVVRGYRFGSAGPGGDDNAEGCQTATTARGHAVADDNRDGTNPVRSRPLNSSPPRAAQDWPRLSKFCQRHRRRALLIDWRRWLRQGGPAPPESAAGDMIATR